MSRSNKSSCSKITLLLQVRPSEPVPGDDCPPLGAADAEVDVIPLQEGKLLHCPHLQDVTKMADGEPSVTWYHVSHGSVIQPDPVFRPGPGSRAAVV